jgi:putative membrane protein insertion efficiency factor
MSPDAGTVTMFVDPSDACEGHRQSTQGPRSRPAAWLTSGIHGYQLLRSGRPSGCRYLPTCSDYAIEAIEHHGAASGAWLTVRRLLRCTPWGGHGVDPVPERRR